MEIARKAAKYLSQACKNFLSAQSAKMEVRKSASELINHKQLIFDFFITISMECPFGTEIRQISQIEIKERFE